MAKGSSLTVNVLIGSRSHHLHFYVTKRFKEMVTKNWDIVKFPHTARLMRDPCDPSKKIPFKSERQFIEVLIWKECIKGKFAFDFDMETHNPLHPDFLSDKEGEDGDR